jgi:hypothetical protein
MSQETVYDPREDVEYEIMVGQQYLDTSSDSSLVLAYVYDDYYLFRDESGDSYDDRIFRSEPEDMVVKKIAAGTYELQVEDGEPVYDGVVGDIHELLDHYESEDGRTAAHKAEAVGEVLDLFGGADPGGVVDDLPDDHNEMVEFEEIGGIGSKAAQHLRHEGYKTKGDVRDADRSDLIDVPLMGESNTDNLLDHVADA